MLQEFERINSRSCFSIEMEAKALYYRLDGRTWSYNGKDVSTNKYLLVTGRVVAVRKNALLTYYFRLKTLSFGSYTSHHGT